LFYFGHGSHSTHIPSFGHGLSAITAQPLHSILAGAAVLQANAATTRTARPINASFCITSAFVMKSSDRTNRGLIPAVILHRPEGGKPAAWMSRPFVERENDFVPGSLQLPPIDVEARQRALDR